MEDWKYLELEHRTGYRQLYLLSEQDSAIFVREAAKLLKMRLAEAWATLIRGNELTFKNSTLRLAK